MRETTLPIPKSIKFLPLLWFYGLNIAERVALAGSFAKLAALIELHSGELLLSDGQHEKRLADWKEKGIHPGHPSEYHFDIKFPHAEQSQADDLIRCRIFELGNNSDVGQALSSGSWSEELRSQVVAVLSEVEQTFSAALARGRTE